MTTSRTYLKRAIGIAAASLTCFFFSAVAVHAAWQSGTPEGCSGNYGWPIKPFDRPHQIRGAFGDPRTQFEGPPTLDTLLNGGGSFSFHQGVDITAPDGTAVYPVASGTVTRVTPEWVGVDCGNGRSFEYWHINAKVRIGQKVVAGRTVLGVILHSEAHVHLTELENGRAINPLARGRLLRTRTRRRRRSTRSSARTSEGRMRCCTRQRPRLPARRSVDRAESIDTPGLRTPGVYRNWPVTPARLTWRIERGTAASSSPSESRATFADSFLATTTSGVRSPAARTRISRSSASTTRTFSTAVSSSSSRHGRSTRARSTTATTTSW